MSASDRPSLRDTIRSQKANAAAQPPPTVQQIMEEGASSTALDRRTTIYMSTDVWKEMKHHAVDEERNISQIIDELCRDYLDRKRQQR